MEDALMPENIKSDINIFQGFSDAHIKERLDDAALKASHDQISEDALINATRAWTRHLLYNDWFMNYGGVQSASTFGNSQTIVALMDMTTTVLSMMTSLMIMVCRTQWEPWTE